jgi:ubiquitin carboxyl-terminal hydrolase 5/13
MDAAVLAEVRAALKKVRVPSSYDRVYKDECVFSFATPESPEGIFVNLNSWVGVGSRFLDLDHLRSGNVLYYNERHKRIPIKEADQAARESVPKKLAIGGDDGFQVDKKDYTIEKEYALALMPKRIVIPLTNTELPELVLQAVAAIQVGTEQIEKQILIMGPNVMLGH